MAIITSAHQTAVASLYTALFNRAPDASGFDFWVQAYANGASLDTISQGFVSSPESSTLYPPTQTAEQFVVAFYNTVFGRAPDPEGLAFWMAALVNLGGPNSPAARAGLLSEITTVLNTPLTEKPADMSDADYQRTLADRGTFANKNTVGVDFAVNVKSDDVELARKVTSVVTDDPASLEAAKTVAQTGELPPTTTPGTGGGTTTPPVDVTKYEVAYKDLAATKGDALLYVGDMNPSTGFVVATNAHLGLELGLDVRYTRDSNEVAPTNEAKNRFEVDYLRAQDVRFAYSVATTDKDVPLDLTKYDFKLLIDTDPTAATSQFVTFTLAEGDDKAPSTNNVSNSNYQWTRDKDGPIVDDGGTPAVTQNIQAVHWYAGITKMAPGAQHDIKLQALYKGTTDVVAESAITIDVKPVVRVQSYGDLGIHATKGGFLLVGTQDENGITANPSNGFVLSTNTDINLQLGLDARKTRDSTDIDPTTPAGNTFSFTADQADAVRFAYSVATLDGKQLDLTKYDVALKIDRDGSARTDFLTFNLAPKSTPDTYSPYQWLRADDSDRNIVDDGGNAGATQNIEALYWFADNLKSQPSGSYAVELTATLKGTAAVVAHSEIVILIADPAVAPPAQ